MSTTLCKRIAALCVAGSLLVIMVGCSDQNEVDAGEVSGYNYTRYYIAGFDITNVGQGQELSAGGPNIFPREKGEARSGGGGGMCCIGIPRHWRPGMKVVVSWDIDKLQDGKTPGKWYTATTKVPPYGPETGDFVVHFLSGDRIRVQVEDDSGVLPKIDDHDPYIAQGVLDTELNKGE